MRITITVAVVVALIALTGSAQQRPSWLTFYERTVDGEMGGGVAEELEAPGPPPLALTRLLDPPPGIAPSTTAPPYPFFPQAGTLWQDLFVTNFVDLGSGGNILDYECTGYTYSGHTGHDAAINGFREQAIGVPIFAALDGTVTSAHDGEPDQQVTSDPNRQGNYVILSAVLVVVRDERLPEHRRHVDGRLVCELDESRLGAVLGRQLGLGGRQPGAVSAELRRDRTSGADGYRRPLLPCDAGIALSP